MRAGVEFAQGWLHLAAACARIRRLFCQGEVSAMSVVVLRSFLFQNRHCVEVPSRILDKQESAALPSETCSRLGSTGVARSG